MYRLLNKTIDFLTGFDIDTALNQVLRQDTWTREQIIADQEEKFKKLSDFALRSEYYKNLTGKKLADFPVMHRETFKLNYDKLKTGYRKPYSISHTSGSTLSPVSFLLSREMLLAKRVSHQKMLRWYGLAREDPELKIGGIRLPFYRKIYYILRNKRYIDSFSISRENCVKLIRLFNHFKPKVLYGYPSAIDQLIKYAEIERISLHEPEIIVTHAENLSKEIIDRIKKAFRNARIVNQYWASEANIAVTCPEGRLHIDEDTVICEVINKNEDGIGDLLITNLYSYDLPIIRYNIGDRVMLSSEKCPCGRESKIIESICGRKIDLIDLPDGRTVPVTAIYLSQYSDNILSYQIIYHKNEEQWELLYIPINKNSSISKDKITEYIRSNFGIAVRFTQVDHIDITKGGKFRRFIN